MKRFTRLLVIQVVLLTLSLTFTYSQYKKRVDADAMKSMITILASDEYQGRETGTKGCEMTEEFFAKEFEKLGLKPAGENGSYYYYYYLSKEPTIKVVGTPSLVIGDRVFYYGRDEDFREAQYTDGGEVSGDVVYVDWGIPSQGRNDFENMDIKGKIVLVKRGCPNDDWDKWKNVATDSAKAEYCSKQGAIAMLLFDPTSQQQIQIMSQLGVQNQTPNFPNALSKTNPEKNFPILIVDQRVARYLGFAPVRRIGRSGGARDAISESKATGKSAKISLNISVEQPKKVRDVLAMIPGTDSKLKNEAVVIGGHLDHLGVNARGQINPGADDNASGSVMAIGVAQAMVKNKFKPKRTIIFAGWSGEEKGLLGSKAWCENPTWDMSKIVVYFNNDMVGLGTDTLDFPGIFYGEDVWKYIKENSKEDYLGKIKPAKGGPGGSDQTYFLYGGVPAFAGMTGGMNVHPDYHQPGDVASKIRTDVLQFVGDWMYHCIDLTANSKENLIAKDRNSYIKYLMANTINLYPVNGSEVKAAKEDKNLTLAIANYSEGLEANNPDKNFITILKKLEEINKSTPAVPATAFVSRRGGSRGPQIVSAVDLKSVGYDELYCKTLAKTGAKIGFVGNDAPFINEKENKTLRNLADAGMIVILKNLSANELLNALNQVDKPVAIWSNNTNVLTDEVVKLIESKDHLFIYEFSVDSKTDEIFSNLQTVKMKIESKNAFACPSVFGKTGNDKIKDVFIALDRKNPKDDFQKNIFSSNYTSFVARATPQQQQQTQQRAR